MLSTRSQEHPSGLLESESVLQRTRAWLVYAGLTLPLGLLAHVLFEAVGGVMHRAASIGAEHALLALVAGTAFTVALGTLRRGTRAERRLRAALLRRALPSGARLAIAGGLLQALVAATTLAAEGVSVDPAHLAVAALAGLLALLAGALVFFVAKDSLLAFAAALIALEPDAPSSHRFELGSPALARYASCTVRLRAGRGPPAVFAL